VDYQVNRSRGVPGELKSNGSTGVMTSSSVVALPLSLSTLSSTVLVIDDSKLWYSMLDLYDFFFKFDYVKGFVRQSKV